MVRENSLRELRESSGLTAEEVAEAVGISVPYLYNLERGTKRLNHDILVKFADLYDTTIDYIVGRAPMKHMREVYRGENEAKWEAAPELEKKRAKPEMRRLIAASKRLTPRQVELIADVAEEWAEVNSNKQPTPAAKVKEQAEEAPAAFELHPAAHKEGYEDVDTDGLLKHIEERARVVEEREKKNQ